MRIPRHFDTVIFDVDGVMIDTSQSFPQADVAATKFLVQLLAPSKLPASVDISDVRAFRRAGGFNSDWDVTQALSSLLVAQRSIWAGEQRAEWPLKDFANHAAEAYSAGSGGLVWLRREVSEACIASDQLVHEVVDQYYWGTTLYERYFGSAQTVVPHVPGYVQEESLLAEPQLLHHLGELGVTKLGLITGRVGPELDSALDRFASHFRLERSNESEAVGDEGDSGRAWQQTLLTNVVDLSMFVKPNPQALLHVANVASSTAGVYVGDTRDDLTLVQRYQSEMPDAAELQPFIPVMVAAGTDAEHYLALGAEIVISSVNELPDVIAKLS